MKTLYLVRHAKALPGNDYTPDVERTLAEEGYRQLGIVSKFLVSKNEVPDLIISSYATRTTSTALYLLRVFNIHAKQLHLKKKMYESSPSELLRIVNELDEKLEKVMLVGHNPTIAAFSQKLSGEEFASFPTCSVVRIDFENLKWKEISFGTGELNFYEVPR